MKNIVLTCIRDEEDVIEAFVRFYVEMGFDQIFVVDNLSRDRSGAILKELQQQGLPLITMRDDRMGYARYLSEYFHWAGSQSDGGWVFILDADEFILFPKGVKDYLAGIDAGVNVLELASLEMLPFPRGQAAGRSFLQTTRADKGFDINIKEVCVYHQQAKVFGGKHRIEFPDRRLLSPKDIFIRHYKYRTWEQSELKEQNKVESHSSYQPEEFADICVFGAEVLAEWREWCRADLTLKSWSTKFDEDCPCDEDVTMTRWLAKKSRHEYFRGAGFLKRDVGRG